MDRTYHIKENFIKKKPDGFDPWSDFASGRNFRGNFFALPHEVQWSSGFQRKEEAFLRNDVQLNSPREIERVERRMIKRLTTWMGANILVS